MDKQIDIITTSLEALLQRGTNPKNVNRDDAAIEAFCGLVNKEPDCCQTASRLIISKMQSMQEWEALQALQLLQSCMEKCGSLFHSEVGKFRFLNELIKLISPKYLGNLTPEPVRNEIIKLLYMWTTDYAKETKIKEAYDMLKKQGVVQNDPIIQRKLSSSNPIPSSSTSSQSNSLPPNNSAVTKSRNTTCSILEDENRSKLLQKLLQSKNPEDLKAANKLIKSMVTEEEKKMEQRCKIMIEIESITNSASLLNEMLDYYSQNDSDVELIKELYATCTRFRPTLVQLVHQIGNGEDDLIQLVISTNDTINEVMNKYNAVMKERNKIGSSLLDMNSARPSPNHTTQSGSHLDDLVDLLPQNESVGKTNEDRVKEISTNTNVQDFLTDLLSNQSESTKSSKTIEDDETQLLSFNNSPPPNHSSKPTHQNSTNTSTLQSASNNMNDLLTDSMSNSNLTGNITGSNAAGNSNGQTNSILTDLLDNSNNSSLLSNYLNSMTSSNILNPTTIITSNNFNTNSVMTMTSSSSVPNPSITSSKSITTSSNNLSPNKMINKLKALKDLDELVGESINQLNNVQEIQRRSFSDNEIEKSTSDKIVLTSEIKNNCDISKNNVDTVNKSEQFEDDDQLLSVDMNITNDDQVNKSEIINEDMKPNDVELLKINEQQLNTINDLNNTLDKTKLNNTSITTMKINELNSINNNIDNEFTNNNSSKDKNTKSLADINIKLEDIEPSNIESIKAMDDKNNISILIHLTKTKPRNNVIVYVINTISKHKNELTNYLFQPVVPKGFKLKLQRPSSTSLPGFNPFLPCPTITQVMLIAYPAEQSIPPASIHFKFVVSYEVEEETISEMGEILDLPMIDK